MIATVGPWGSSLASAWPVAGVCTVRSGFQERDCPFQAGFSPTQASVASPSLALPWFSQEKTVMSPKGYTVRRPVALRDLLLWVPSCDRQLNPPLSQLVARASIPSSAGRAFTNSTKRMLCERKSAAPVTPPSIPMLASGGTRPRAVRADCGASIPQPQPELRCFPALCVFLGIRQFARNHLFGRRRHAAKSATWRGIR